MLIFYAGKWAIEGEFSIRGFLHFVGIYLLSFFWLQYYNHPLPWTSSSSKTLFPDMAADLANIIANSRFDSAMQRVLDIANNLQHPALDAWAILTYINVEVQMWFIGGLLLLPIGLGFIAIGLGAVFLPLVIPFMMVPRLSWLFWSGITYMVKYSFYRVWAVMLTYVWAGILIRFLDSSIFTDMPNNTYSLAQFTGMVPIVLIFLNGLCMWTCLCLPGFLADFFNGTASTGGSGFLSNVLPVRI